MVTLNLDYLEFNATIQDNYLVDLDCIDLDTVRTENFIFSNPRYGGKYFEIMWDVFTNLLKGEPKVGIFMSRCKTGRTEANYMLSKFRYADWLFYYSGVPYEEIKTKLCDQTGVIFKSLSRIDLALDTDEAIFLRGYTFNNEKKDIVFNDDLSGGMTGEEVMRACRFECLSRDARFNRSMNQSLFDSFGRGVRTFTTYFGSKKGDVYARMYNKTEEMRQMSREGGEKDYITECWQHCGYDNKKDVFRFEIVLQHLSNKKKEYLLNSANSFFIKNDLQWCEDIEKIKSVFQAFADNYFSFHKHGTRLCYLPVFDTGTFATVHNIQLSDKKVLVSLEDIVLQHTLAVWACEYVGKMAFSNEARQIFTSATRKKLEAAYYAMTAIGSRYEKTPRRCITPRYLTGGYRLVKNGKTKINV